MPFRNSRLSRLLSKVLYGSIDETEANSEEGVIFREIVTYVPDSLRNPMSGHVGRGRPLNRGENQWFAAAAEGEAERRGCQLAELFCRFHFFVCRSNFLYYCSKIAWEGFFMLSVSVKGGKKLMKRNLCEIYFAKVVWFKNLSNFIDWVMHFPEIQLWPTRNDIFSLERGTFL